MLEYPNTAVTSVPFPGSDSIRTSPPLCLAESISRGMPMPTFRVVREVKNGSDRRLTCSEVIPLPLSPITMVSRSAPGASSTVSVTRVAPALIEFWTMSSMCIDRSFIQVSVY